MEAHISSATQITQKEPKETTKERGIFLTIMGQRSIYNSTHKPHRSLNETLGLIMMTTYTECAMKQEFLNSWNSKFQEFLWS